MKKRILFLAVLIILLLTSPIAALAEDLIKIEPLSEEGWFFYVEDYNVWRRRNNTSH